MIIKHRIYTSMRCFLVASSDGNHCKASNIYNKYELKIVGQTEMRERER